MELQTRFQDAHSLYTPMHRLGNHQYIQNEMRVHPEGGFLHLYCRYPRICYHCVNAPAILGKCHKAQIDHSLGLINYEYKQ